MYPSKTTKLLASALLGAIALPITLAPAMAQETVTIVLNDEPRTLEPCQSVSADVGRVIVQNVTESLTQINPVDGSIEPRLATKWEQVNDSTWRFHLRDGVTFQDGTPFDAADVVYTLDRMKKETLACTTYTKMFGNLALTGKVIDAHTIEIAADNPTPIFPTMMGLVHIVPEGTPENVASRAPVGTGPYKFVSWMPGENIVLQRRDDYWGKAPAVAGATYIWRTESALRAAMVATGEADIAPSISLQDASDPKMDFSYLNSETTRMRIDMMTPPLNDLRVRTALNLAIDKEGLKTLLGNDVIEATQFVVPSINGHNPDLVPFPYDPDKARSLLAEARADGVPVDDQINLIVREGQYSNSAEVDEAMMSMWQDVGFNVKMAVLDVNNWYTYLNKPFPENRGPLLFDQMHDNNNGDASFTAFYNYSPDGLSSTVSDPAIGTLISKAGAATGDERKGLFQEVFRKIHDELVADVFMFHMVGYTRVGPRISWTPNISTNSQIELAQISFNE
jgi:peptide/nickel transport system substrate-binding protein